MRQSKLVTALLGGLLFLSLGLAACSDSESSSPGTVCTSGETTDCIQGDGMPGQKVCVQGAWSGCRASFCEVGATRTCTTACNTEGRATCNEERSWGACQPPTDGCNGVDDDCDGQTDEDQATKPCLCGAATGTATCVAGEWGPCSAGAPGAPELCDNLDNDCDGQVDEDVTRSCQSLCGEGRQTCEYGEWGACSTPEPRAETCNGQDDDCDGETDEDLGTQTCGLGECLQELPQCADGEAVECDPFAGSEEEVCDLLDNDCDGETDEDLDDCCDPGDMEECSTNVGVCEKGTRTCGDDGQWEACTGVLPAAEICDGLDNDCDGTADENNPGGGVACGIDTGECQQGTTTCTAGELICRDEIVPTVEICDGKDNDCDGAVDEDNPGGGVACGIDTGECQRGVTKCTAAKLICENEIKPTAEVCDGLDNDCNDKIDDGVPGIGDLCGTDEGECRIGVLTCTEGQTVCVNEIPPTDEICDGLDNDCDGQIDVGFPGQGEACGVDTGECQAGVKACIDGKPVCDGEIASVAETCDAKDNDCDGKVDQGLNADIFEANDTCPLARDLGLANENGLAVTASATLYKGDLSVDGDWYKVVATEAQHLVWCGDNPLDLVPQCYWVEVTLTGAPGQDQDLCYAAGDCEGSQGQDCLDGATPNKSLALTWFGTYLLNDSKTLYFQVKGAQSCQPYGLSIQMFGTCPDANGLCPWEE